MFKYSHLTQSTKKIKKKIYSCVFDENDLQNSISAKDALLGRHPGHCLLGSKYMKTNFSISRQYLMGAVVKYNYHLVLILVLRNNHSYKFRVSKQSPHCKKKIVL